MVMEYPRFPAIAIRPLTKCPAARHGPACCGRDRSSPTRCSALLAHRRLCQRAAMPPLPGTGRRDRTSPAVLAALALLLAATPVAAQPAAPATAAAEAG